MKQMTKLLRKMEFFLPEFFGAQLCNFEYKLQDKPGKAVESIWGIHESSGQGESKFVPIADVIAVSDARHHFGTDS